MDSQRRLFILFLATSAVLFCFTVGAVQANEQDNEARNDGRDNWHPRGPDPSNSLLRCTRPDETQYMVCHNREDEIPKHCKLEKRGC
ncbi:hypothetical protein B566_EDAN007355 [Ephemera danica]|nr:hypothetical protein B566_EDAN007355 [Ephemera danica]